jgi:UDP-N-acetyl-D-mannosaminuronic acid dehydrogenase
MHKKTVCVIGLGYIGLPTAALLATHGHDVVGVDLNTHVVDTINQGQVHIVEPDLDAFVRAAVFAGKLKAYTKPQVSDIYMICVPTPFHEGHAIPQPNIDYVMKAASGIASLLKPGDLVILESTSPVGTTQLISDELVKAGVDVANINIAYCPERVLPGKIMTELVANDRVVGGLTSAATRAVVSFYQTFVRGAVLETDAKTAEMCKLTENSFRDVNIAFANELSIICANQGVDVWKLIGLANRHPRVNILQPGTGVGGHCIAVDPWFIISRNPEHARLMRTAREVNNYKTDWVIEKIDEAVCTVEKQLGRRSKVACLGLAFKPDIDDLRESPAVAVATALVEKGYEVLAVEPNIERHDQFQLTQLTQALEVADVVAVLVKHRQFNEEACRKKLSRANVLDFCGLGLLQSVDR